MYEYALLCGNSSSNSNTGYGKRLNQGRRPRKCPLSLVLPASLVSLLCSRRLPGLLSVSSRTGLSPLRCGIGLTVPLLSPGLSGLLLNHTCHVATRAESQGRMVARRVKLSSY